MIKIFLTAIVTFISLALFSQPSQKAVNEICKCFSKIDTTFSDYRQADSAYACLTKSLDKYKISLRKEFKTSDDSLNYKLNTELYKRVNGSVLRLGKFFVLMNSKSLILQMQNDTVAINPDTLRLDSNICKLFKSGRFKIVKSYVNQRAYFRSEGSFILKRDGMQMDFNSINDPYSIRWDTRDLNSCDWEMIFLLSKVHYYNLYFKKGDKIVCKVIGSSANRLWVRYPFYGLDIIELLEEF